MNTFYMRCECDACGAPKSVQADTCRKCGACTPSVSRFYFVNFYKRHLLDLFYFLVLISVIPMIGQGQFNGWGIDYVVPGLIMLSACGLSWLVEKTPQMIANNRPVAHLNSFTLLWMFLEIHNSDDALWLTLFGGNLALCLTIVLFVYETLKLPLHHKMLQAPSAVSNRWLSPPFKHENARAKMCWCCHSVIQGDDTSCQACGAGNPSQWGTARPTVLLSYGDRSLALCAGMLLSVIFGNVFAPLVSLIFPESPFVGPFPLRAVLCLFLAVLILPSIWVIRLLERRWLVQKHGVVFTYESAEH